MLVEQSQLCYILFGSILACAGWCWLLRPAFLNAAITKLVLKVLNVCSIARSSVSRSSSNEASTMLPDDITSTTPCGRMCYEASRKDISGYNYIIHTLWRACVSLLKLSLACLLITNIFYIDSVSYESIVNAKPILIDSYLHQCSAAGDRRFCAHLKNLQTPAV